MPDHVRLTPSRPAQIAYWGSVAGLALVAGLGVLAASGVIEQTKALDISVFAVAFPLFVITILVGTAARAGMTSMSKRLAMALLPIVLYAVAVLAS